ncbi:hypothetical protein WDZ92_01630 [Nostoc sp. NIES-2111]
MKASPPPGTLEWVLPDVLPGICRLFLHVEMLPERPAGLQPTRWQLIPLEDSYLEVLSITIGLRAPLSGRTWLEALFIDEPTLDQLDALHELALRLEERGLPAIVSGRF